MGREGTGAEVCLMVENREVRERITRILTQQFRHLDRIVSGAAAEALLADKASGRKRLIFADRTLFDHLPESGLPGGTCVLVLEQPDFFALQEALRAGVSDCLLYPFTDDEMALVLDRLSDLMRCRDQEVSAEAAVASRYLFWHSDVKKLRQTKMTIPQVNREYGTSFSDGLFRAVFVEMSCRGDPARVVDNHELQDAMMRIVNLQMRRECFDLLFNRHSNGISMLLNYSTLKRNTVSRMLDQLFFTLRREMQQEHGVEITMCIGRIWDELAMLPEAKQELLDARWSRKQLGSGRIIHAEEIGDEPAAEERMHKVLNDRDLILHYFELLDDGQAVSCMKQLLEDCRATVSPRDQRLIVRECMDFFFKNYNSELQSYGDPDALRHNYVNREVTAQNVESYEQAIIDNIQDVMRKVQLVVRRQYTRPVQDCIAYISRRHCKDIRLSDLARLAHLSPQYLSARFHRETGQSLSEYLNAERMNLARIMLTSNDGNVGEIADFLGFSDARYFSKFFKARQNLTPTDYRRMKQAELRNGRSPSENP